MSGNRYFFFDERSLRRLMCWFNAEYKNIRRDRNPPEPVARKGPVTQKGKELVPGAHSVAEFCAVFGMTASNVHYMRRQGKLETVKVGRRRLIPHHEFERYRDAVNGNRPPALVEALDLTLDRAEGNDAICLCFRGPRNSRANAAAFIARQLLAETVGDTLPALTDREELL